ncbi:MAG: Ku protein [Chlamydiales bacterium]|nr:Ku protein [Chlamydiales bacterium]
MRAMWTGALTFGLINIPIKLYSATEDHAITFDLLHKKDLSPIRYARICKEDGKEIPYNDIVKGYEYKPGDYVVLLDEDFERASVQKTKSIEILDFIEEKEIDSIYYEKPYYLEPAKGAEKAYVLLRESLKKSKKVGLARFVFHTREHLCVIRPYKNIVVLEQLRFDAEIRNPQELKIPKVETSPREVAMALKLISQLTAHFDPKSYNDTYQDALKKIIKEKSKGIKSKPAKVEKPQKSGKVKDIMHLLKESLEQHHKKSA